MNNLLNAESAFCEELAVGTETYIDPLRSILPESTHAVMFLGLTEVGQKKLISDTVYMWLEIWQCSHLPLQLQKL